MKIRNGESISAGIGMGKVFLFQRTLPKIESYEIPEDSLSQEVERYQQAIKDSLNSLESLLQTFSEKDSESEGVILSRQLLGTHIAMLSDPFFSKKIPKAIQQEKRNAEWVLLGETRTLLQSFAEIEDEYLRQREIDLRELCEKILNRLLGKREVSLREIPDGAILIAADLMLSDLLKIEYEKLAGIILERGGKTSHTAILIRASHIPFLIGCQGISKEVKFGDFSIIDGNEGVFISNPSQEEIDEYQRRKRLFESYEAHLVDEVNGRTKSADNVLLKLMANIGNSNEIQEIDRRSIDGVGLFRSEFLFLNKEIIPDEEAQYQVYSHILKWGKGKPITIRTIDLGGEKRLPEKILHLDYERNPLLGVRGVRFTMLHKEELFIPQLRALLRASTHGNLKILIPMINDLEEFCTILDLIESVKRELESEGVVVAKKIPVGIMIETPSAVLTSDVLAKRADFFAIGTNDLTQYTLVVDRENQMVNDLFNPLHLSLLRSMKIVINSAKEAKIPVHPCGELAGYPTSASILLGMGLRSFSMNSVNVPAVKKVLRSISVEEASIFSEKILACDSSSEADALITAWKRDRLPQLLGMKE